jgi:hypothetical protein
MQRTLVTNKTCQSHVGMFESGDRESGPKCTSIFSFITRAAREKWGLSPFSRFPIPDSRHTSASIVVSMTTVFPEAR